MTNITVAEAVHHARVAHSWYLDSELPHLTQKQSGRRVTINPGIITITAARDVREGLHVLIEGQTVRQNGTPGQQRRGVSFVDNVYWSDDYPMSELPAEYQPYLEAARRAEAAR